MHKGGNIMRMTNKEMKDAIRFACAYGRPPKLSETQNLQVSSKEAQSLLNKIEQDLRRAQCKKQ